MECSEQKQMGAVWGLCGWDNSLYDFESVMSVKYKNLGGEIVKEVIFWCKRGRFLY